MRGRIGLTAAGLWLVGASLGAPIAAGSTICAAASPDGSGCAITAQVGEPFDVYIVASLSGDAAADGFTAAWFSLPALADQTMVTLAPNPAADIALDDPLGCGATIGFPTCQTGSGGRPVVLLYTLRIVPTAPIGPRVLRIQRRCDAMHTFVCPMLSLCDAPVFTRLCVPDCETCLNTDPCPTCTVGVEAATWSRVKSLYGSNVP